MSSCQLVAFIESHNVDISKRPLSDMDVVTVFWARKQHSWYMQFHCKNTCLLFKIANFWVSDIATPCVITSRSLPLLVEKGMAQWKSPAESTGWLSCFQAQGSLRDQMKALVQHKVISGFTKTTFRSSLCKSHMEIKVIWILNSLNAHTHTHTHRVAASFPQH